MTGGFIGAALILGCCVFVEAGRWLADRIDARLVTMPALCGLVLMVIGPIAIVVSIIVALAVTGEGLAPILILFGVTLGSMACPYEGYEMTAAMAALFTKPAASLEWSAVESARRIDDAAARVASAGDRESEPEIGERECPPRCPDCAIDRERAEAVRRPVTGLARARTVAAPVSLRGRDGRPTRAMTAVLGACAGALLAAAWLHPIPFGGQSGDQTQGSLYQELAGGSIDVSSDQTRHGDALRVLGTELPGLPGLWIDGPAPPCGFWPMGSTVTRESRQHAPRPLAPECDGLPDLGGNLPGRDGRGKAKHSGVVDILRPLVTYFTYRYKYRYYREHTHIRIPQDRRDRMCVDPYRGYIYREKAVYPVNHTYVIDFIQGFSGNSSSELPVTRSEGVSSDF